MSRCLHMDKPYCGADELDAAGAAPDVAGAAEDEALRKTLALALATWSAVGDDAEPDDDSEGRVTGAASREAGADRAGATAAGAGACEAGAVPASGRLASDGPALLSDAPAAGGCCPVVAGWVRVILDRSVWSSTDPVCDARLPTKVRAIEQTKKAMPNQLVSVVSKLPVPRADMKPDGPPPMPSAPPSERWSRMRAPMAMQIRTCAVSRTPKRK